MSLVIKNKSAKSLVFFLFLVMFLPTKNFYIFYGPIVLLSIWIFIRSSSHVVDYRVIFVIFSFICLFFSRATYYGNIEDLKELFKLLIFFNVLYCFRNKHIRLLSFYNILSVFVQINFSLSLMQFFHINPFGALDFINPLYVSDNHIVASLSYSIPRVIGLSAGPGQQAVISLFCIVYFVTLRKTANIRFTGLYLNITLCVFIILLTQSKTLIVAIPFSLFLYFVFSIKSLSFRQFFFVFTCSALTCYLLYVSYELLVEALPELSRLINSGLGVSSFQARLNFWHKMTSPMFDADNPFFYFLGIGRSALENIGLNEIAYDSDYIYLFVNFGLVGLFVFIAFHVYFISIQLFKNGLLPRVIFFSVLCPFSLVVSLALSFYLEPRVYLLTAFIWATLDRSVDFFNKEKFSGHHK